MRLPYVEVVCQGNSSRGALGLAYRPVLRKGAGTSDRGLVNPLVGADRVCGPVRGDSAEICSLRARVIAAVGLNNVVLGLRAVDPTIRGEVGATASGVVSARVGDGSIKMYLVLYV